MWLPSMGLDLVPLVPCQLRQTPAKKNSGRLSSRANQVGIALPERWSYSQKLVTGTRHRNSGRRYGFQYREAVFLTFVTRGGPLGIGDGKPQRIIITSR